MNSDSQLKYWNPYTNKIEYEKVYGDQAMRFLYENPLAQFVLNSFLVRPITNKVIGAYQSSPLSKKEIGRFIAQYQIPMQEYEEGPFRSFNDFFIRRFRPGKRQFVVDPGSLPAPAEGRYFGWGELTENTELPVKGLKILPSELLKNQNIAKEFVGGPALLCRLCPVDYHRFHFPDEGKFLEFYEVPGLLHSVNPVALKRKPEIFCINERQVSILETKNFGKMAYVEVGALCVGKIVQSALLQDSFKRGEEKGYFLFGASTVIVFGQKESWRPHDSILEHTKSGMETYIKLGDLIGQRR